LHTGEPLLLGLALVHFSQKAASKRKHSMKTSLPQYASVTSTVDESPRVRTLVLDLRLKAEPGQFIMAWLPGVDEKPFSLVRANPVTLTVAQVGAFSQSIHGLRDGDSLWVRGPLGVPFTLPDHPAERTLLLVGGGYGVAPLYFLTERAILAGCETCVVIGARTGKDVVFADRFLSLGAEVIISTDDGSLGRPGLATEAARARMEGGDIQAIYACGPEAMLESMNELAQVYHLPTQLSYERYMRCGFGVCGSCVENGWLVCRDGPVKQLRHDLSHS
jgi:dihydroorotate dehydrogenase electron transfer subunit